MIKNTAIFVLIILLTNSCHPVFCGWKSGYERLTQLENKEIVIGKYVLSKESKNYLKSKGYSKHSELNILKSGNFKLTNIPKFVFDFHGINNDKSTVNFESQWYVSCDSSYICLIELEKLCVVPLTKNSKGLISIQITIGDPDECKGIVFEYKK